MYNKYFIITGLFLLAVLISGCQEKKVLDNYETEPTTRAVIPGDAMLEVSYEMTTYQVYHYDFEELTELDLAYLNPSEEKQRVEMYLMPDGTVNMNIEELDFLRTIDIPHETAPSDAPKIRRTEIIGNNMTFYDGTQKMLGSQIVEMQRQPEMVEHIKELFRRYGNDMTCALETMQGDFFSSSMDDVIAAARANGQLTEHSEEIVSIRTNLSEVSPLTTGASVVFIDKNNSRVVVTVTYNEQEKLSSCTFYGYEKEGAPILNATRTETLVQVPSGAEVWQITSSKIEHFNLKLNPLKID
ncbi:MAG: hypothetical protein LBH91_05785 [Prevotellaceae bacterium]|jgi:hypothetical protein|nr:hypothetical protein [Prevotellaceae bacterium]